MKNLILVALCLVNLSVCQDASKVTVKCILVALPTFNITRANYSNITITTDLIKLITVSSEIAYEILVDFIVHSTETSSPCACSEVIGVVGDIDSSTVSIIHTLASMSNLSITLVAAVAPSTFLPVTNLALPHVLDMNPLVHYIEALVSFTDQLNWTRIGLISDGSHYHEFAAELFQVQRKIAPYIYAQNNSDFHYTLQKIKEYKTQVIVISMDGNNACLLIEEAKKMDMRWPEYVWLFLDYKASFISTATCDLEGVIILSSNETGLPDTAAGSCNSSIQMTRYENMFLSLCNYSKVLYDSVLAVVLADSFEGIDITNTSFTGATGLVKFRNGRRLTTINVVQMINNAYQEIANFNSECRKLVTHFDILASSDGPRGGKLIIYGESSTSETVSVMIVFTLSFFFVSVILALFILFREEKEIKATSFTISLCMFLGCYILLFYIPLILVVNIPHRVSQPYFPEYISCSLIAWLGILGIPSSLTLAALFVKMIRVYAIFENPFSYKKRLYSDYALLLYIIIIVSPNFLTLFLWTTVDTLTTLEVQFPTTSQLLILEGCHSTYTLIWLGVLLIYMLILILSLVVIAFKTSTIRYKHFQDTKATNAFAFFAIFLIVTTLLYFSYYNELGRLYNTQLDITLYVGHTLFALCCQIFMFVPKVLPPFQRWLSQKSSSCTPKK